MMAKRRAPGAKMDEATRTLLVHSLQAAARIRQQEGTRRGVRGEIPCPHCGSGRVRYSIAQLNGHIWAQCTTPDCVRFLE